MPVPAPLGGDRLVIAGCMMSSLSLGPCSSLLRPRIARNFIGPAASVSGLAIGAVSAAILAPALLVLGLAMSGLYAFGLRSSGRAAPPVAPPA